MCILQTRTYWKRETSWLMEFKFSVLKMYKRNISMNRAQRLDENNAVICLVLFTPQSYGH